MSIYHDISCEIEHLIPLFNKHESKLMSADIIDIHPLVAIDYCLFQLFDNCHINHNQILHEIFSVMDETWCIIGNHKIDEIFDFDSYPINLRLIKGNDNRSYLSDLIHFIKDKYNRIMFAHKNYRMLF